MLVLAVGKETEYIDIDGPCRISVIEVRNNGLVRLGFEAPQTTHIMRSNAIKDADGKPRFIRKVDSE